MTILAWALEMLEFHSGSLQDLDWIRFGVLSRAAFSECEWTQVVSRWNELRLPMLRQARKNRFRVIPGTLTAAKQAQSI